MIRRPPRSTRRHSSAASDVYKRQVITLSELDWITNHQSEFSRLDMAFVIKIGRLMDSGVVEIDNRLSV